MDYTTYQFSKREYAENILLFLMLDGMISYLFFRSWIAFVLGLSLIRWFLKERKDQCCRQRKEMLAGQFLYAMQTVASSLTAGYSAETAFEEAAKELSSVYSEKDLIMAEMKTIVSRLNMNQNLEDLLLDLSSRSEIEDIRNFAEIFAISKRTGGNLIAIIRNTTSSISKKEETRKEIQAALSAKKMEQKIMSVIPCLILVYVQLMSPGFLDGMYHNAAGILIMGICLAVYGTAFIWGRKIVEIEV